MVNQRLSPLGTLTIILIVIIVLSVLWPNVLSFLALLITLLLGSILLLLHLVLAWTKLAITRRYSIILSILAWMGLFYGMVHANSLSIASFFS